MITRVKCRSQVKDALSLKYIGARFNLDACVTKRRKADLPSEGSTVSAVEKWDN